MRHVQVLVIGGGSAGLSAAITLKKNGIEDVLVVEKDHEPGGILQQCIHNGFGLQTFHEQLSGPAYAERFIQEAKEYKVEILSDTMVLHMSADRIVEVVNAQDGYQKIQAEEIVLAVGCYERSRGAVEIPGTRPAGIYTAGQAQRYLNLDGYLVGKKVFILGSGDIGLIMARRMTLEGAKVYGVAEVMPYSNGLPRNIKQCLEDFGIPLFLSHTVTHIYGNDRLEKIEVSEVDANRKPIAGTEMTFEVDTLLLSVGLIPENHLAEEAGIQMNPRTRGPIVDENYQTSVPGIFACGNGLHVHDLVDFVTLQAKRAAEGVVRVRGKKWNSSTSITCQAGENVGYVVPGILHPGRIQEDIEFFFRVRREMTKGIILVKTGEKELKRLKRAKLVPSEMERIRISKDVLNTCTENLQLEVVEEL